MCDVDRNPGCDSRIFERYILSEKRILGLKSRTLEIPRWPIKSRWAGPSELFAWTERLQLWDRA